jgi:hypothetical protein
MTRPVRIAEAPDGGARQVTRDRADAGDPHVELLWFEDCPNHAVARLMLREVLDELAPGTGIEDVDATDPALAARHRFPGSPTVRIDGQDVDPSFEDPGDYAPRCRLYRTAAGLRGVPERGWIVSAVRASLARGAAGAG